jgi:hypothetical protein
MLFHHRVVSFELREVTLEEDPDRDRVLRRETLDHFQDHTIGQIDHEQAVGKLKLMVSEIGVLETDISGRPFQEIFFQDRYWISTSGIFR